MSLVHWIGIGMLALPVVIAVVAMMAIDPRAALWSVGIVGGFVAWLFVGLLLANWK